jgi:hypothetical protein
LGHYSNDCKKGEVCFKCGKASHKSSECKVRDIVCFNYGEARHISTKCTKSKKAGGKVFALNADEVKQLDNLIRGMCFINSTPLIAIIDMGDTHSFISLSYVERLNLVTTLMLRGRVIDVRAPFLLELFYYLLYVFICACV